MYMEQEFEYLNSVANTLQQLGNVMAYHGYEKQVLAIILWLWSISTRYNLLVMVWQELGINCGYKVAHIRHDQVVTGADPEIEEGGAYI